MRIAILFLAACGAAAVQAPKQPDEVVTLDRLIAATPPDDPGLPELKFRLATDLDKLKDPRAIATYREIIDNPRWTSYPRRDEVLFWYAFALGKGPTRDAVLAQLIATYPSSKYRDDAYVSLGDAQFEAASFPAAIASYQAVHSARLVGYAHYKLAWTYRNLGDDPHARAELEVVLATRPSDPKQRVLYDAAKKDLVAFAAASDPNYVRADELYAQKDFCAAAPLYAKVATDEAAYAHVLATRSCEHLDDVQPPSNDTEVAIPASWQHLLDATDVYLNRVQDSPELPDVQFLRAQIFYGFGHFEMAARNFREVVRRAKTEDETRVAAVLLLESDNRDKIGELVGDLRTVCAMPIAKAGDLAHICAAK
jgi:tetratricopeptide (TPR) repeat protein